MLWPHTLPWSKIHESLLQTSRLLFLCVLWSQNFHVVPMSGSLPIRYTFNHDDPWSVNNTYNDSSILMLYIHCPYVVFLRSLGSESVPLHGSTVCLGGEIFRFRHTWPRCRSSVVNLLTRQAQDWKFDHRLRTPAIFGRWAVLARAVFREGRWTPPVQWGVTTMTGDTVTKVSCNDCQT